MNEIIINNIVTAIGGLGVIIIGVVAWVGKIISAKLTSHNEIVNKKIESSIEQSNSVDLDLRERRINIYKELWKSTDLLPKLPKSKNVTYEHINEFSIKLRDWYFDIGGMFLSSDAHKKGYIPLQESIGNLIDQDLKGIVTDEHYENIRLCCSKLRTLLTDDIVSRKTAPNNTL